MRRLLRLLAPLADMLAGFHLRVGEPRLPAPDYRAALGVLRPGDVILTRESWRPTNILIRGSTKHAAIFVGRVGDEDDVMVEATHPVARYTSLIAVWQMASRVVVLRPNFTDDRGAADAAVAARSMVGTPYDTAFEHGEEALYCSELIDAAYEACCGSPLSSLRRRHLGLDGVILPDDLRTSGYFRVVWDSDS